MTINSSIRRQFEFIQQQWVNYAVDEDGKPIGRTIINGNKALDQPTYMCSGMPRVVETRGGDYVFIPSMTALRMIGEGIIDPT